MAGGLLSLVAYGNQNIIINGNPTKSFFKAKYSKYTNFGLQKFRIDQVGQKELNITKEQNFTFKILRYGDLLLDTFLCVTLPNIWSPILKYDKYNESEYRPYEFKWIKNIGTQLIKEVTFTVGGHIIQKFSGSYIQNLVDRDFDHNKKELFNIMSGNVKELNDPENYLNRNGNYPNAFNDGVSSDISGIEPSIYSQKLYIPINSWFSLLNSCAFPLISLQYAELEINFLLRPVEELFVIRDVIYDNSLSSSRLNYKDFPYIQPKQSRDENYGYYHFVNPPPTRDISLNYRYSYDNENFNYDIHLLCTQCFLDEEERNYFANNPQSYLIKEVYEYNFERVNKTNKIKLESNGLVANWMWYFQRNDVNKRNEWSNYTNWDYEDKIPNSLNKLTINSNTAYYKNYDIDISNEIFITGNVPDNQSQQNFKEILNEFGILCDGKYRENVMTSGIYNKIEKYKSSLGSSKQGLYCYNFELKTSPYVYQPDGAFNTNKFKTIEFEYNLTSNPPFDPSGVDFRTICDPITGEVIATSKEPTSIYKYNFDLRVFEERYNILKFQSGMAGLEFSR